MRPRTEWWERVSRRTAARRQLSRPPPSHRADLRRTMQPRVWSCSPRNLMTEWPHTGQDHGQVVLVRRRDHLGISDRAARLDDRRDARPSRLIHPVPERKERVAREHGALGVVTLLARLVDRQE